MTIPTPCAAAVAWKKPRNSSGFLPSVPDVQALDLFPVCGFWRWRALVLDPFLAQWLCGGNRPSVGEIGTLSACARRAGEI